MCGKPIEIEVDSLICDNFSLQGEQNVAWIANVPAEDFRILKIMPRLYSITG